MPGPYLNQGIFKTLVTANDSTQQEELGVWRFEAGKVLRYVQTSPTLGAIQAGAAVKVDAPIVTALLAGNQVRLTTGFTDMVLGIAETTLAQGNFGWITCFGPATAMVITNTLPGQALGASSSTGVLAFTPNTSNFNPMGMAIQTGLSAGSSVFVTSL